MRKHIINFLLWALRKVQGNSIFGEDVVGMSVYLDTLIVATKEGKFYKMKKDGENFESLKIIDNL